MINFIIQKHRIENNSFVIEVLEDIGAKIMERGFSVISRGVNYGELFDIDKYQIRELFALFCLRITYRSARYPAMFAQGNNELRWLNWINKNVKLYLTA